MGAISGTVNELTYGIDDVDCLADIPGGSVHMLPMTNRKWYLIFR